MGTAHAEKNEAAEKDEAASRQLHAPATPTILQTQFYHFSWFFAAVVYYYSLILDPLLSREVSSKEFAQEKKM
jgi:hypothetical protein